jgi:hypothetical protein
MYNFQFNDCWILPRSGLVSALPPTLVYEYVADCGLQTCQITGKLKRATKIEFTTGSAIIFIHCCKQVFIHTRLFVIYLAVILLSLSTRTNQSTKHKFVLFFLSVGNPKTGLRGGYSGWRGGSSFTRLSFERWLPEKIGQAVGACKSTYDRLQTHLHTLTVLASKYLT